MQGVTPFFQDQAVEAEAHRGTITAILVEALDESPDVTGVSLLQHGASNEVEVDFHGVEIPRYPPDDDGPRDRDYWEAVRDLKISVAREVREALALYRREIRRISVEYMEKSIFRVKVDLK